MKSCLCLVLIIFLSFQSNDVFAAGAAVKRRQQMQAMQQQAIQQEMMQQAVMQQRQAQATAQQQAQSQQIAQYQAAQQQAQARAVAMYQQEQIQAQAQKMLQQVHQQQAEIAQVKAIHQQQAQIVDAQQMALATQMAEKYQAAIMQEAVKQKIALTAAQMAQVQQLAQDQAEIAAMQMAQANAAVAAQAVQHLPYQQSGYGQIEDVVDITDVWKKLDIDSRAWTLLVDEQAKVSTVSEYIDRYLKTGVSIKGSPAEYVQMIDQLAVENPSLLNNSFKNIVQLVAIMQYDFDNGMNKDALANKMLGQQLYEANKKRLGR